MLAGNSTLTVSPKTTAYLTPGATSISIGRRDANRADQSWYFTLTNKGDPITNGMVRRFVRKPGTIVGMSGKGPNPAFTGWKSG